MLAELQTETCPHCKGCGIEVWYEFNIPVNSTDCPHCNGTGLVLRCRDCDQPLEPVRPGAWQCSNRYCPDAEKGGE